MQYNPNAGSGSAAVEWIPLEFNDPYLRPFLLALLYARILTVHEETQAKLFQTIDELSKQNVRDEGQSGFLFPKWTFEIGAGAPPQTIWPWTLHQSPRALSRAKVYKATLQTTRTPPSYFGIHLKMPFGQERILAPASPLVAISSYVQSTDQRGRYELAVLLWQINEFYRAAGSMRLGSEAQALATATVAICRGDIGAP